jgi:hypothetical protein
MQAFEPTFFSRRTPLVRLLRAGIGVAIAGLVVAAWSTAGPGNYDRVSVAHVTLPQVTVVGRRDAIQPTASTTSAVASCERAQVDTARAGRTLS